jgi:hypothetical protein
MWAVFFSLVSPQRANITTRMEPYLEDLQNASAALARALQASAEKDSLIRRLVEEWAQKSQSGRHLLFLEYILGGK